MNRGPQLPLRPKVTIIGGGVIGLAVAYHLREVLPLKSTITVLEKAKYLPNPDGSSSRSAACFRQHLWRWLH